MRMGEIKGENTDGEEAQHQDWGDAKEPAKETEEEGPERQKENQEGHVSEVKCRLLQSH